MKALALLFLLTLPLQAATCTGQADCRACSNCSKCKHCHIWKGKCGVCAKKKITKKAVKRR